MTYTYGEETKYPIPNIYDDNYINDVQYIFNKDVVLNYFFARCRPGETDLATVYASGWTDEYYNKYG